MAKVFKVDLTRTDGAEGRSVNVLANDVNETLSKLQPHLQEGEVVEAVNPSGDADLIA